MEKIFEIFSFFLVFLVFFLKKNVLQLNYFSMTLKNVQILFYRSDFFYHNMQKKNDTHLKNFFFCIFYKTVGGTFCATCAVTGYPCLYFDINLKRTEKVSI